ncbi:MAG: Na+/H+ antiporter subunit G [Pirellulaceae bacterium]|nr:Na+/H+ antiporter subunit G [Pirellulaceae bacterium]
MSQIMEIVIAVHIVIGSAFVLVGSYGLIRLPDLMSRLHGPSKATTLGVGGCLIASVLYFTASEGRLSIQEVLITCFLFLTAPVTAHFIAKAYLHTHKDCPKALPLPKGEHNWSTFDKKPS